MDNVNGKSESFNNAVAEWRTGIWQEWMTFAITEASNTVQLFDSHNGNRKPLIKNAGHFKIDFCNDR